MAISIDKNKIETLEVIEGEHIKIESDLLNDRVTISAKDVAHKNHVHNPATSEKDGFLSKEDKIRLDSTPTYDNFKQIRMKIYFDDSCLVDKFSINDIISLSEISCFLKSEKDLFSIGSNLIKFSDDKFEKDTFKCIVDAKLFLNKIEYNIENLGIYYSSLEEIGLNILVKIDEELQNILNDIVTQYGSKCAELTLVINYINSYNNF